MTKRIARSPYVSLLLCAALILPAAFTSANAVEAMKPDRVVVKKSERRLYLLKDKKVLKSYNIYLGREPVGAKRREGDLKTPEGRYLLDWKNTESQFYRSIHVSYPNYRDKLRAQHQGVSPGGQIMIHGMPNDRGESILKTNGYDWTNGCIALKNRDMDEIWAVVEQDTLIEILP